MIVTYYARAQEISQLKSCEFLKLKIHNMFFKSQNFKNHLSHVNGV
jgi:hypothetical protein